MVDLMEMVVDPLPDGIMTGSKPVAVVGMQALHTVASAPDAAGRAMHWLSPALVENGVT